MDGSQALFNLRTVRSLSIAYQVRSRAAVMVLVALREVPINWDGAVTE